MWYHSATLPMPCVTRYGYFQVSLVLDISESHLQFAFQTNNSYFICGDPLVIDRIFARLRNYDGQVSPHRFELQLPA